MENRLRRDKDKENRLQPDKSVSKNDVPDLALHAEDIAGELQDFQNSRYHKKYPFERSQYH
jgi:hypothetical protein